jgi:hypothetical protein
MTRPQFSIRWMMGLTVGAAVASAALRLLPDHGGPIVGLSIVILLIDCLLLLVSFFVIAAMAAVVSMFGHAAVHFSFARPRFRLRWNRGRRAIERVDSTGRET